MNADDEKSTLATVKAFLEKDQDLAAVMAEPPEYGIVRAAQLDSRYLGVALTLKPTVIGPNQIATITLLVLRRLIDYAKPVGLPAVGLTTLARTLDGHLRHICRISVSQSGFHTVSNLKEADLLASKAADGIDCAWLPPIDSMTAELKALLTQDLRLKELWGLEEPRFSVWRDNGRWLLKIALQIDQSAIHAHSVMDVCLWVMHAIAPSEALKEVRVFEIRPSYPSPRGKKRLACLSVQMDAIGNALRLSSADLLKAEPCDGVRSIWRG
jgi:hypothetical protein